MKHWQRVWGVLIASAVGLLSAGTVATADTGEARYLNPNTVYVRTNRAMYVGISQKTAHGYRPQLVKKDTLLKLAGQSAADNRQGQ